MDSIAQGRFDEARHELRVAEAASEVDQARGALFAAAALAFACVTEQYDDRPRLEASTRARFGALPHALGGCIGEMFIAQLHGRAGDLDRARAQLAIVRAHQVFASIEEPAWLALLTEACCLAGDRALAERLYAKLSPRAQQFAFLGPLTMCPEPPYSRQLGLLAHALDRIETAEIGRAHV